MDISSLREDAFADLVRFLLEAEGKRATAVEPRAQDIGIDFVITDPSVDNRVAVVEIKHSKRPLGLASIMQVSEQLERSRDYLGASLMYLVTSSDVGPDVRAAVDRHTALILWDRATIESLLAKHDAVRVAFEQHLKDIKNKGVLILNISPLATRCEQLAHKLRNLPPGLGHWREYEDLCIEVLNFLFVPDLGVPVIQSRSEDGLDRRDAIYPIHQTSGYWHTLRHEFSTRFVVAEFKNHSDEIGQKEVESIKEYLLDIAFRTFGLLCSRKTASESAIKARRRAWMEGKKIVMLSDVEILEMLQLKRDRGNPTDVIERHLQAFLIVLTP
jgi:hypothetical protein